MSRSECSFLLVAGFVASSNISFAVAQWDWQTFEVMIPLFKPQFLPFQVMLLLLLQSLLADSAGWAIAELAKKGGTHTVLMLSIGILIAWTSLFNIQWILLGKIAQSVHYFVVFIACSIIALAISVYFIDHHWRLATNHHCSKTTMRIMDAAVYWQVFVFILIETFILIQPLQWNIDGFTS